MFHFAVMPMPAAPPMASHQRGSPLLSSLQTKQQRDRPADEVRRRRGELVQRAQVLGAAGGRERRDELAAAIRTEDPCHRPGAQHHRGQRERGQRAQPDEGVPGDERVKPGQQRRQFRLVHAAERQVVPGGEEVQLVPDVPVPGADRQFQAERGGGHQPDRPIDKNAMNNVRGVTGRAGAAVMVVSMTAMVGGDLVSAPRPHG